jgi:hypothetical protein
LSGTKSITKGVIVGISATKKISAKKIIIIIGRDSSSEALLPHLQPFLIDGYSRSFLFLSGFLSD